MLVFCAIHAIRGNSILQKLRSISFCVSLSSVWLSPAIKRLIKVWRVKLSPQVTPVSVCLSALIKYIRPVFVSRSDQDSRRKTVEEIKRRAHSGAEWPQVPAHRDTSLHACTWHTFRDLLTSHFIRLPDNIHIHNITFFVLCTFDSSLS